MQYLRDYAAQLNLNIQYNTEIMSIRKEDGHFVLEDQYKYMYHCNKVIIGLVVWCVGGLAKPAGAHKNKDQCSMDATMHPYKEGALCSILFMGTWKNWLFVHELAHTWAD